MNRYLLRKKARKFKVNGRNLLMNCLNFVIAYMAVACFFFTMFVYD